MHRSICMSLAIAAIMSLGAVPAVADRAAADACAAKLPTEAKLVYSASIGSVAPGIDLRDMVTSKTRSLVFDGKLSRAQARPAAEAAGACLKQAL